MAVLDPANPMRALREAAGLNQSEAARARGVAQPSQSQAETQGAKVQLATLLEAAKAFGVAVELRATKPSKKATP